jgi:hypothetical protein
MCYLFLVLRLLRLLPPLLLLLPLLVLSRLLCLVSRSSGAT